MKLNTNGFSVKCQHPMLLALAFFPLGWLLVRGVPGALPYAYLFPAAYVLLAEICILLPGKCRLPAGFAGALLLVWLGAMAFPRGPLMALFPLCYTVLLFLALPIGGWSHERELNLGWPVFGVLTHVLMQLLIDGSRRLGEDVYAEAATPVLVSFLLLGILAVLAFNRTSLKDASMSRRTVPLVMRRANKVLVLALLVLGVLIAAVPVIGGALSKVWGWIIQLLLMFGTFLSSIMPQNQSGGGGGTAEDPGDVITTGVIKETSGWMLFLEKVMGIAAMAVAILLLAWFLWVMGKKLLRLARELWIRWNRFSAAAGEDYEDEITSTRDEADVEREGLLSRLRRIVPENEAGLNANERIRNRYKRLKHRREWSGASTARETLPEQAATLYERVRYGGESLSDREAEAFREGTKKV